MKRSWPAVQAEIRRLRPSRAHLFDMSEVEVEGDLLVVEFPKDQRFALDLASDSDTLQLLRRSVGAVLGVTPPIEFRLGRQGASSAKRPRSTQAEAAPQAAEASAVVVPVAGTAPARCAGSNARDLERMLIDELGRRVRRRAYENDRPIRPFEHPGGTADEARNLQTS